jgi:hypothetical protein
VSSSTMGTAVPIYEGVIQSNAIQRLDLTGRDPNELLAEDLPDRYPFHATANADIVRDIKVLFCSVVWDYPEIEAAPERPHFEKSYELPDGEKLS